MQGLMERLQREVKANGKKAGLLAGLVLFGCCFWVPMALRAVAPSRAAAATSPTPSAPTNSSTASQSPATDAAAAAPADGGKFWTALSKSLAEDPMFRSAELESLSRDPFQIAEGSEPLPVVITEAPKSTTNQNKPEAELQKLELSGTIIGRARSVARINGQLYPLGQKIKTAGQLFQLTKIESHEVELSSGDQTIKLTLTRPQLKDVLERGELIAPLE